MKYPPRQKKFNKAEGGFAAIIVTLVVITIVILLVLGFVAIVSRENRSSIDQQLSTQAFYAAETGVNDVTQYVAEGNELGSVESCDEFDSELVSPGHINKVLDDDVEYTCVLVDDRPNSLVVSSVKTDNPTTLLLKAVDTSGDPVDLKSLTISWQAEDVPENIEFPGVGTGFPEGWTYAAPVLRTALTNLVDLNRQSLVENTYTMFLRPNDSGLGTSYGLIHDDVSSQGEVVEVGCSESLSEDDFRLCSVRLEGLDVNQSEDGFLLVLRAIYTNADVHIGGTDTNDNEVLFADQQMVIDSTGRANDVLRRVQARVPIQKQYRLPGSSVETSKLGGVCKRFTLLPPPDSSESQEDCPF